MKSYTDIEQSKTLAEILPLESADAHYVRESTDLMGNPVDGKWGEIRLGNPEKVNYIVQNFSSYEILPCWSLAALLGVIPDVSLNAFKDGNWSAMVQHDGKMIYVDKENPVDACIELIIKLTKLKIL